VERDVSATDLKPKPWALLAYTVADDKSGEGSLDTAAKEELKAMCEAADFGQVSIAAQVDFKRTRGVFRGTLTKAPPRSRGFEDVRAENHPLWKKILGKIDPSALRVQMEQEDLNAARANVLQEFLSFGHQECPADRYVIFFYGHAYGPMGLFYDSEAKKRDPQTLRLNDLAGSIEAVDGRAAVVVFRDCYMNTLETACQLRGVADFMIASQSEIPIAGIWPWKSFMAGLAPSATSGDVARTLAQQLAGFLDEPSNRGPYPDVPIALVDVSAVDTITGPLKALADALDEARRDPARGQACAQALEAARTGYSSKDHVRPGDPALLDVPTLCDSLQALGSDPVVGPATALGDAVRTRLVVWHHSQQGRYQGTSIYYKPVTPKDLELSNIQAADDADAENDANAYKKLALIEATGWDRIALNPLIATSGTGQTS
jgi:hypothetical protein